MIQPFQIIEGLTDMGYIMYSVSDRGEDLPSRQRYKTTIGINPWGKMKIHCTCDGFKYRKECSHITEFMKILKEWGEIE